MSKVYKGEKLGLNVKTLRVVEKILQENPTVKNILESSETIREARLKLREWILVYLNKNPHTKNYYLNKNRGHSALKKISFRDYAAMRLMDYLDNENRTFIDPNRNNIKIVNNPIKHLWLAATLGKGTANEDFFLDMLFLFRQLNGKLSRRQVNKELLNTWMDRHPSGLDPSMTEIRLKNKIRIIQKIIEKIDSGEMTSKKFAFTGKLSYDEKFQLVSEWWNDYRFHLIFAIRTPEMLNEFLDFSLRESHLKTLKKAKKKGIPIFINPYFLSLISVEIKPEITGADLPLRDYILPNKELIAEFGNIHAWEKEDIVQPGEPNAAGWILPPYHNVHRRYPEVAIFIPDTAGRACGGLCVSCQRMYDFQSGRLNFDLKKLAPKLSWNDKMKLLLKYWEEDTQLRDVLVTGGDSFMNSNNSLSKILDEIYAMALNKKNANNFRPTDKKFAEIIRVRLGTRLPAYLPQRVTPEFVRILKDFKTKASKIGVKQFVVQTHIQSAMEITPEVKEAVSMITKAGWMVTNQLVFTAASSRRGHTAKLREVLNDIGVIPYYTFSVKGFMENYHNFATNERAAQERVEEKYIGQVSNKELEMIEHLPDRAQDIVKILRDFRKEKNIPFISTDRSVLNMPGVGKSLSYRTIGITDDGRRILEFEHDHTRTHSPIIDSMGNVVIIESKSINNYLKQMEEVGEDITEYKTIWGYSASETEQRMPVYQYPKFDFEITSELTNYSDEYLLTTDVDSELVG